MEFLEKKFPIPSDGNISDFGGGLQHHLRDFAHHPTIVGLIFSMLTQFTGKSYGTDTKGVFMIVDVPDSSKLFIGGDIPTKLLLGTVSWFFHLVSDIASSSSTAGLSGGTGIPGPILSLAKELSCLPLIKKIAIDKNSLSKFLSKLFNGTFLSQRDANDKIIKDTVIKFDLRGDLGSAIELGRQAIPVIANDCLVRSFFFIRRFAIELREEMILSIPDMNKIDWNKIIPKNNPIITRMLTIATGIFTTVDISEAIITHTYLVSINYIVVGRFAIAISGTVKSYAQN